MGCPTGSAAIILFCCICVVVALSSSMAAAASAAPVKTRAATVKTPAAPVKTTSKFISMGALECSDNVTKKAAPAKTTAPARKLIGVHHGNVDGDVALPPGVCPVRFDLIRGKSRVTGSCRDRPVISPERCCGALKSYACPYSDLLNDMNNGCANDMFYQIIVRGRLEPGLFSHMCPDSKEGLQC